MGDNRETIKGKYPTLSLVERISGDGRLDIQIRDGEPYLIDQKNNEEMAKWDGAAWDFLGNELKNYTGASGGGGEASEDEYSFSSSDTWTINHGLGRHPQVEVFVGGEHVMAEIDYPDADTVEIHFAEAETGTVYLNY